MWRSIKLFMIGPGGFIALLKHATLNFANKKFSVAWTV
jgi:hypothetical protein